MKSINILVLDGGGSKGIYTIGVLKELELKLGKPLYEHFELVYGTSTGSIITALIALGYRMDEIENLYLDLIPKIMNPKTKKMKSDAMSAVAKDVFRNQKFDSFRTNVGIVALNCDTQLPLIFKTNIQQAHGMKQSFKPGFDCTIEQAVRCSCSAYPFFEKMNIETSNHGKIEVVDGGYIANNSTLYAMIDAYKALGFEESEIRLLNVGVGNYIEPPAQGLFRFLGKVDIYQFIEKVLTANTNSNTLVCKLLFPNLNMLRISDSFLEQSQATNMFEHKVDKLNKMFQLGRGSFAKAEKDICKLFQI